MSLLSIQVTELIDGIFIGCSTNHAVIDGTSYWHFFKILSNTFSTEEKNPEISRPPFLKGKISKWHLNFQSNVTETPELHFISIKHMDFQNPQIKAPAVSLHLFPSQIG
ncbi:hypothetical protein RHGRI_013098 [Rhododendron griersonianum]|uniref:Uncharacterized protein n=1 Tax=Rhododendron griersonianum TaxID=479676 RepID=A0AAV6K4Q2_9ERIC|nr:hypothetical protein RHGRI_013098 [Rhododendron griersonianum]